MPVFKPIDTKVPFSEMEQEILHLWNEKDIIKKYLNRNNQSDQRFSFIDGPITANNPMGVHHAWGRTYKDIIQRYKTMKGFKQRYQNGFDGQGLWIEVEVEKELGFRSKRNIEEFGIDKFVELCKERVLKFSKIQTDQSLRLGYWMDWENSYHTMSDENNYAIWNFLKICHEKNWLYEGTDVMPWCPRCGTGISEHEIVTDGYRDITHQAVYVEFPLENNENEALIIWTTTPWTLSANIAAAVNPEIKYVKVKSNQKIYYLAKNKIDILKEPYEIISELSGNDLIGMSYRGPFDELPVQKGIKHKIISWEEVSDTEGTGIVHIATGAGKEDFLLGKANSLPTIAPLDESGYFIDGFDWLSNRNVSEVNDDIFNNLTKKNLLYKLENYLHRYPVCWRCETELVFRLVKEWFISMDELRALIANVTSKIRWIPDFGLKRELDWLNNMDDWMISKKRYWGLALPIYKCNDCHNFEVIGSKKELKERSIIGWDSFEGHSPHRPWIDEIKIKCLNCNSDVSRIKDVGNPWLDAGIVPYSTLKYGTDGDYWNEWFPADWISESFPGQFRNWFYSLLTMSTVLENTQPTECIFGYALMRDENGEEMHKSRGNAIWFDDAAEDIGSDVMRWLFSNHNPSLNLNFGHSTANEVKRQFFIPLWNTYNFFATYATLDEFNPNENQLTEPIQSIDKWILSELNSLIKNITNDMDDYDLSTPSKRIEEFTDILSNWYVRRSRRRFWKSENDTDKYNAYSTLYICLSTLTKLLSPFVPFTAETIYQNLVASSDKNSPLSVHLTEFPVADETKIDINLSNSMNAVMKIVNLGRSARNKSGIRIRQPLSKISIYTDSSKIGDSDDLSNQILEELNIKEIEPLGINEAANLATLHLNNAILGPKYEEKFADIMSAFNMEENTKLVKEFLSKGKIIINKITIESNELDLRAKQLDNTTVVIDNNYILCINTHLSEDLLKEGWARELVHAIQNMRKSAGLNIEDRINITYKAEGYPVSILENAHLSEYIKNETLATQLEKGDPSQSNYFETISLNKTDLKIGINSLS